MLTGSKVFVFSIKTFDKEQVYESILHLIHENHKIFSNIFSEKNCHQVGLNGDNSEMSGQFCFQKCFVLIRWPLAVPIPLDK